MKTPSMWGPPPSRFYRYLRLVQASVAGGDVTLAVLGCADGKFVLPAARAGMRVYAVDIDRTALFGGVKQGLTGPVSMPGLRSRLSVEHLEQNVEIVCADYRTIDPAPKCHAAFMSGVIQYSNNMPATPDDLLNSAFRFVRSGGFFYLDYMLPFEDKYKGRPNCPEAIWWKAWLRQLEGWKVLYNRVLPPVRDFPHVEFPEEHFHQWGHVLLRREW